MGENRNSQFCKRLGAAYAEDLVAADKRKLQDAFGSLNVQQRLNSAGFRHLFKSLAQVAAKQSGS